MIKHERVNSLKVHGINLQHSNLSFSNSLASCENDNIEAQYLLYTLKNYELTLGDWKIGGAAEDDKQANLIALKPAIRRQVPQKRVHFEFPNIEFWNITLKDSQSYLSSSNTQCLKNGIYVAGIFLERTRTEGRKRQ